MVSLNSKEYYQQEIARLKREKNAVILVHYYQEQDIQEVADFIGDSLELSRKAMQTQADVIVFAGVHFMAETAKILNYNKTVLLPDLEAGCSLAESCQAEDFRVFRKHFPNHVAVTYINCSAEIKALSDIVCTSANAVKIIESIPEDKPIIFAPDKNLGKYLMKETGRNLLLWDGACVVHEAFSIEKLAKLMVEHPDAKLIAHPESEAHILKVADFVGSTSALLKFVQEDSSKKFIIATEFGILNQMELAEPDKIFIPAPVEENNSCACSECAFMKVNTLEKLYVCLRDGFPEIQISQELQQEALLPIQKMLTV